MDLLLQVLPMLQTVEFYWDDPRCRWSIGSWGVTRDGGEGEDETQVMTLQVGCSPDSKIEEACAVVRSALPGLDARNLLSFSSSYDIQ